MRKFLLTGFLLLSMGCGKTIKDPDDNTDALLLGMWDSVSNTTSVCHERLKLNSDKTFWWFAELATSAGTYGRETDKLNFMFTNRAWEVVQFSVTDRQLFLTRVGVKKVYTRVPLAIAAANSPCPQDTSKQ
jgi:hypothetical protein